MKTNRRGFHDIDIDFEGIMVEGGLVDELFRLQDLKNRKLFLNVGIDQCAVADVVKHILQYNSDDKGIEPGDRKVAQDRAKRDRCYGRPTGLRRAMKLLDILVDMDDTIEHLLKAWVAYLNARHGTSVKVDEIYNWDLTIAFPTLTKEQVFAPLVEDEFWKTVEPMEGAAEVLEWATNEGHNVYIVTASTYHTIKSKMENVLFKYFPFISWPQVIIAYNKQMIRGDMLVDDAPHNLENGRYVKVLMTAPHNRNYDATRNHMIRVNNWSEVKECIVKLSMLGGTN